MATFKGKPIYAAAMSDNDETGIYCISLVESPATEADWVFFEEDKKPLQFAVQNEDKHLVRGLIMGADTPIYRISPAGDEYYITYSADVIRQMAQKYLKQGFQNNVDTDHSFQLEDGVYMNQMFIKDTEAGINPKGFEDYKDGSLFAEFKVENEEIWNTIKDGTYKGFSLAGCFSIQEIEVEDTDMDEVMALIEKINKRLNK